MEQILEQYGDCFSVFLAGGIVLNWFLEILEIVTGW